MTRLLCIFLLLWLTALLVSTHCLAAESRGDPAAHTLPGEFASEHWEITARFDSGYLLFVEFIVTNIGLGDDNAVVLGHVIDPAGKLHRFRNGRRSGNWQLSSDRLRMEVSKNLLDLHGPLYLLQVSKQSVKLNLQLQPEVRPLWAQAIAPPGYALDVLALATPIEGTLWLRGMAEPLRVDGAVTVTHSWTNTAGSSLVLRRIEFFLLQRETPMYVLDLLAPNGERQRWLIVKESNGRSYSSEQFDLSLVGELNGERKHSYTVPGYVNLKNGEVEGQVQLVSQILQTDPLANLPRPVRYLVSLVLNLNPRRVWAKSLIDIVWHDSPGAKAIETHSAGIVALTFVNPVSSAVAKP